MTKEGTARPKLRLFVALDLPAAVREGVMTWGVEALGDPALRRVEAPNLHVTMAFLGHLAEDEVPRLSAAVEASAGPAPSIRLGDPVQRPERGRPRFFALPAESAGVATMQAELSERLVATGLFEPEGRPFWPHVTVARVRREERGSKRPAVVGKRPGPIPKNLSQLFRGVRLTLYRSQLQPRGAQYTPLAQVELPADGRQ